jgi:hypothetical protein
MAKSVVALLAVAACGTFLAAALVVTRKWRPADPSACGEVCALPSAPTGATRETVSQATVLEEPPADLSADGQPADASGDASGGRTILKGPYAEVLSMPEQDRPEIEAKVAAVQKALAEATGPLLEQRFADGRCTLVPEGQRPQGKSTDTAEIAALRTVAGKGVYRAALPRSEYPELYQLRDTVVRLQRQLVRLSNAKTREQERLQIPKSK